MALAQPRLKATKLLKSLAIFNCWDRFFYCNPTFDTVKSTRLMLPGVLYKVKGY
jgi:hypothetical protein